MEIGTRPCVYALAFLGILSCAARGQFRDQGFEAGMAGGCAIGFNESDVYLAEPEVRAFFSYPLHDLLQCEMGLGYAINSGKNYETQLVPIDYRFRFSPLPTLRYIPYLYAGVGALFYDNQDVPALTNPDLERSGWAAFIPFGGGVEFRLTDNISLDLSGGYYFTFTEAINPVLEDDEGSNDSFLSFMLGARFATGGGSSDRDGDGLSHQTEKVLGTNSSKADTDEDGLSDGEEQNVYKTDPLNADSDGDDLKDGEEIRMFKTSPTKTDTDRDDLSDGDEVRDYQSDPLTADTDADGLKDGQEVDKYRTDPLRVDTDGDRLKDDEEVTYYQTDPLKADTDGGGVNDGVEIVNETDPLKFEDDSARKAELKIEQVEKIVLQGIFFRSGSAEILPESETALMQALATLQESPDIEVEIHGHTDNVGSREHNIKLSLARAQAVKKWLEERGIAAARLSAKGLGPDNPVAPNDAEDGRQQNRRIEFVRVK